MTRHFERQVRRSVVVTSSGDNVLLPMAAHEVMISPSLLDSIDWDHYVDPYLFDLGPDTRVHAERSRGSCV